MFLLLLKQDFEIDCFVCPYVFGDDGVSKFTLAAFRVRTFTSDGNSSAYGIFTPVKQGIQVLPSLPIRPVDKQTEANVQIREQPMCENPSNYTSNADINISIINHFFFFYYIYIKMAPQFQNDPSNRSMLSLIT